MENYIKSPKSNRAILVDGPAYKALITAGFDLSRIPVFQKPARQTAKKGDTMTTDLAKVKGLAKRTKVANKTPAKGSGGRTKGWGEVAPKAGKQRKTLLHKCGPECFLRPDTLNFPICPACGEDEEDCLCQIDCRGLMSAKIRANQWKYLEVAAAADQLYKDLGCV